MPDARGDVLCPTCGRWTPPAPFCNECGAALQGGFRDPVGAEGSDVFRRGSEVADPGAPWSKAERFEPEPEDEAARRIAAAAASAAGAQRVDNLSEQDNTPAEPSWPAEPGLTAPPPPPTQEPAAEPAPEPPPADATDVAAAAVVAAAVTAPKRRSRAKAAPPPADGAAAAPAEPTPVPEPEPEAVAPEPDPVPPPSPPVQPPVAPPPVMAVPPPPVAPGTPTVTAGDGNDSNGGVTGLVFVLFLGLGVLALLGGAIIGGVFEGGPSAAASPSPTVALATPSPEATPSGTPQASASAAPTASSAPTEAQPTAFPDGFVARGEVCLEQPTDSTCGNSGAVNHGSLWILVSFRHGVPSDVIGVSIFDADGSLVDGSTIPLDFCGTSTDCAGYTYFHFQNLGPGDYEVKVFRNGALAAVTGFTVQ